MLEKPNMVIVKLDDTLVQFPLDNDGKLSDGKAFDSDYIMEECNLIFALFDEETATSKELYRFSFLDDKGDEQKVKLLYEQGEFQEFVKYIVEQKLDEANQLGDE